MIPNIPNANVPIGVGDTDNPVLRTEGTIPAPVYDLLPHWELAESRRIADMLCETKRTVRPAFATSVIFPKHLR